MKIRQLELTNFKAFKHFSITIDEKVFIIGPNNAGKSTIISAMKLCASLIRHASLHRTDSYKEDKQRSLRVNCHSAACRKYNFTHENLRHDFNENETRIHMRIDNGSHLYVIWPAVEPGENNEYFFFYLEDSNGGSLTRPESVKKNFPSIGVVPTLTPIESQETTIKEESIAKDREGRLAARHFRNYLYILKEKGGFEEYKALTNAWTPEIQVDDLVRRPSDHGYELDLFFKEPHTRTEREIFWAGDGLQIWLQILLHYYINKNKEVLILDEPDVFLHADLQRRVVRLLNQNNMQTITATHSPEMLLEAGPDTTVWVDKSRKSAIKSPKPDLLFSLSVTLGSSFNLRLAKALKAKTVLMVEGHDSKFLLKIAEKLHLTNLAEEKNIAIIPIHGFSNNPSIEPFKWFIDDFLDKSVRVFVILDRDYRCEEQLNNLKTDFDNINVDLHIWTRKEIESYLLLPNIIAKMIKLNDEKVTEYIEAAMSSLKHRVHSQMLYEYTKYHGFTKKHMTTLSEEFMPHFEHRWSNFNNRLAMTPPKEILSLLNVQFQSISKKATSFESILKYVDAQDISPELTGLLKKIERSLEE